jgi:phenylpyruvate tautomerase PptA (4-oxalocrotonate tautomerase family)
MPIVDVTLVVEPHGDLSPGLAQSLADVIGRALKSPPGQTWVRLHVLASDRYAENQSGPQANDLPVFATVLQRRLSQPGELEREISALTEAIAQTTVRPPDCVHVEFAPAAAGRLSFGGKLVT